MLRIHRSVRGESVRLKLEGSLSGPWLEECRALCAREAAGGRRLELDLAGVGFADAAGEKFLRELSESARFRRISSFLAELLRSTRPAVKLQDAPTSADPADLRSGLRAGRAQACERLVRRHAGELLALARLLLRSEAAAMRAVREAFAAAFARAGECPGEDGLRPWLRRLLISAAAARLEEEARGDESTVAELLPRFDASGHHLRRVPPAAFRREPAALGDEVLRGLARLPALHRLALVACDVEGLPLVEVGGLLGLAPTEVASRLHQARQALLTVLANEPAASA